MPPYCMVANYMRKVLLDKPAKLAGRQWLDACNLSTTIGDRRPDA